MECARLTRYGLLSVTGEDARAFLHAQLTKDIENLPPDRATLAGWCSAKGRLLASLLVIPAAQGFLLQLSRDLAPGVARKLALFVLRAKVRIADVSDAWAQFGVWGDGAAGPADPNGISRQGNIITVQVGDTRYLVLGPANEVALAPTAGEERWTLQEIRAGRPLITAATQDKFVPQMVNFDELGAVDFRKGCYPGQEIVARAQYRGQVKRRMVGAHAPAGLELRPGQEFKGGTVIDVAPAENGSELLAVMPI